MVQRNQGLWIVQPDDGGKDVFLHVSALERAGLNSIAEGQKINYEVGIGPRRPHLGRVDHARPLTHRGPRARRSPAALAGVRAFSFTHVGRARCEAAATE